MHDVHFGFVTPRVHPRSVVLAALVAFGSFACDSDDGSDEAAQQAEKDRAKAERERERTQKRLEDALAQLDDAKGALDAAEQALADADDDGDLEKAKSDLGDAKPQLDDAQKQLEDAQKQREEEAAKGPYVAAISVRTGDTYATYTATSPKLDASIVQQFLKRGL